MKINMKIMSKKTLKITPILGGGFVSKMLMKEEFEKWYKSFCDSYMHHTGFKTVPHRDDAMEAWLACEAAFAARNPIANNLMIEVEDLKGDVDRKNKVLLKYADPKFWRKNTQTTFALTAAIDIEQTSCARFGGKLAREEMKMGPITRRQLE